MVSAVVTYFRIWKLVCMLYGADGTQVSTQLFTMIPQPHATFAYNRHSMEGTPDGFFAGSRATFELDGVHG